MGGMARNRDRIVNKGTVNIVLGTLNYDVVFAALGQPDIPYPYIVRFAIPVAGITLGSVSNQTPSGFRITFAVVLGGTLDWAAIETMP